MLFRSKGAKEYDAQKAQAKTTLRHNQKYKHSTFSTELKTDVKKLMYEERYSPELVVAHWNKEGVMGVSHETIYQFIWECKHTNMKYSPITRPFA